MYVHTGWLGILYIVLYVHTGWLAGLNVHLPTGRSLIINNDYTVCMAPYSNLSINTCFLK